VFATSVARSVCLFGTVSSIEQQYTLTDNRAEKYVQVDGNTQ